MIKYNKKQFLFVLLAVCVVFSTFGMSMACAIEADACICGAEEGKHTNDCSMMTEAQDFCTPVEGASQEDRALYISPENEILPIGDEETLTFKAGIYLDANRTELAAALTPDGVELSGWTYLSESMSAEDRYLGISLDGLSMDAGKQYQLVVEMAPILYINQNSDPTLSGTTVSFTRNAPFAVNTNGRYEPKAYSLSNLTYLIDSGKNGLTLGLPLRFDVNLWNKQNDAKLGNGTSPLLRVYLQEKQEDGSFATITGQDLKLNQATVSGSFPFSPGVSSYLVEGSSTATNIMDADDSLKTVFSHYSANFCLGHYAKNIEVQIKIPTYTAGGVVYTLPYENFLFRTASGALKATESFNSETGILTLTGSELYFSGHSIFDIIFSAPEALKNIPGKYTFAGKVSVVADGISIVTGGSFSIILDTTAQADIQSATTTGKANIAEFDTVQPLGGLAIKNVASGASGPLRIDLQFDTEAVAVTTVNLMCDRDSQTITIYYTLVDENGDPAYPDVETGENQIFTITINNKHYRPGGSIEFSTYQTFSRNNLLIEEHKQYFFGTLSYTMGNLPGNSFAYHTGASLAPYSAGTIWGYVKTDKIPTVMPRHTMTVYQIDLLGNVVQEVLNASTTTNIDKGEKVPYGLKGEGVSATTVTAGDSVTISGSVFVVQFPYSSNSCLNNICLGIVLPIGVEVNAASINATYSNGSKLNVKSIATREIDGSSNVLHIIEFEEGKKIGYFNENLGTLANGSELKFSIQLNTDKTISTQTINLRECVFVAGKGLVNSASGSYAGNAALDMYDLNGNGIFTDNIGCFSSATSSITIQAVPAELVITDELTNDKGDNGASLTLESFADNLTYKLHVECTAGGSVRDFFYMIPIAKTSMTSDPVFMEKCQVDLELKGPAKVTTSQGIALKVLYSTTPITGYSDALSLTDWYETLPDGKDWSDVTVIKVLSTEDTIKNGSINDISVPLGYAGEDTKYEHMAGYQIQWSSRGYYHYTVGYNSNSGTQSTRGSIITLTYTRQDPIHFTLTAAKDGKPAKGENTYVLDLEVLFYLAQEYRVKQITPYNVNLMGAGYDFDTATSAEANENFRINISVKKQGDETAQNAIAMQKDNDIIGALDENSRPVFTFTIENADALSDIVTERKVTLTLIGSNGVIIPVEITIKRELATAEPTTSAIVAGELYAPFEGITSTMLSSDSAFTAQFVTEYIPANYTGHAIVFQYALAKDTTITMIDWTDRSALKYYHYTMDGNTTTVTLTAFQGMGSSSSFTESSNTSMVMERLLFIVSFPDGGESIRENTMKLTKALKEGVSEESSALTFATVQKRSFSLESSENSVMRGNDFTISYTSGCSVTDSRYSGRTLSLVVKPSGETSFPVDSHLVVDGVSYYLNAQGTFLVPLKSVQTGNGSVTVSYYSQTAEQISFQVSLWASATANGSKPFMGEEVAESVAISVSARTAPSFKVVSMSKRLLERADLSNTITVSFIKENATTVTIELQKKAGADYVTQTTILESVNGQTSADAGQGIFMVTGTSATIKISALTETGTYRLLFTVSNGYETIEVPYNFIVAD